MTKDVIGKSNKYCDQSYSCVRNCDFLREIIKPYTFDSTITTISNISWEITKTAVILNN